MSASLDSAAPPSAPGRAAPAVLAALAAIGVVAWLCWPAGAEEDRVRAVIDAIEAGLEEKDLGDVMPHVSAGYRDAQGLTRDGVKLLLLRETLQKGEAIVIQRLGGTAVALRPKKRPEAATASFRATLARGSFFSREGDTLDFEVDLALEDGTWRVVSHRRAEVR